MQELAGKLYHLKKLALNQYRVRVRRTLILQACLGGLGDTLFLSHLPRVAKATGCKRVLISRRSLYRDPNYPKLIWEPNPYVDGFTDEPGLDIAVNPQVRPNYNLLDEYMRLAALDDGQRFHEPEIYMRFEPDPRWASATVYDPNYITRAGAISNERLTAFFEAEGGPPDYQMALRNNSIVYPGPVETLATADIFEFCRLIVSCKHFYCLTTGTATLAAALGIPCTVLWGEGVDTRFHHSRLHRYVRL